MRCDSEDFGYLATFKDFSDYYESLTTDDAMGETDRLIADGSIGRMLYQQCALHRRLIDAACFDESLAEQQRNAVITVVTWMRDTIDNSTLPLCNEDMQNRVKAALSSTDDYVNRYGNYPRAVEMIRLGARLPTGPYKMGDVGKVLVVK